MGSRGYDAVRLSVVALGSLTSDSEDLTSNRAQLSGTGASLVAQGEDLQFEYAAPFKNRWTHAYGSEQLGACVAEAAIGEPTTGAEAACRLRCNAEPACEFYTFASNGKRCVLSTAACGKVPLHQVKDHSTFRRNAPYWLYSTVLHLAPGVEHQLQVFGEAVKLTIPEEDHGVAGIVWADPCMTSQWVPCTWHGGVDLVSGTYDLVNTIAEHDQRLDFWQILGDNFYDQDGRITKPVFDQLSPHLKRRFLQVAVGNHDLWVGGYPPGDAAFDQFGHGFMQFYAQDTAAAVSARNGSPFNLSITPDSPDAEGLHHDLRNAPANFMWYHKLGNLGFVAYNGAATWSETEPFLREACAYFDAHPASFVFLLGHWNEATDGADRGMEAPAVRRAMLDLPGCALGDRLKFIDGHEHCNMVQEQGENEPVGFMAGGRGMFALVCHPGVGFIYIDSRHDSKLRVWYFEEHTVLSNHRDQIASCVRKTGSLARCTQFATLWLESDLVAA
mmetsp:Transcript_25450/g.80977  ORF Transcript_25450/g.80977 Transcript_25450/m.80977 type:complete len:501 (-) Transcript_25450:201-1703(-)